MHQKARWRAVHIIFVWVCEFNLPWSGAVHSTRSDAWQERAYCSYAPATTEVLKLIKYLHWDDKTTICAGSLLSISKKDYREKSRMKLITREIQ